MESLREMYHDIYTQLVDVGEKMEKALTLGESVHTEYFGEYACSPDIKASLRLLSDLRYVVMNCEDYEREH